MTADLGLEVAVEDFVAALTPIMIDVVTRLPDADADVSTVGHDVELEAYNLAVAFVDADGLATDDELWALIGAFGPRLDSQLAGATPADVRHAGLTAGRRAWLDSPSTMFEILVGIDRREGGDRARTYYERALAIGRTVASIDLHHSRTELLVIEGYRGRLLTEIDSTTTGVQHPATGPTDSSTADTPGAGTETTPPTEPVAPPRPLDEVLAELDELVGLEAVKEEVKLVTNLIQVQNLRRQRGLAVLESSRHLVFTGNPGTGKTTVARLLAQIYRSLGVVARGQLVETDRASLVAGFVGQTAPKVVAAFDAADEGVLLIDEAYALVRGSESDFGREAIDTIVKLVEDRRDRLVVIAAGYPDEMAVFIDANPGLRSRFPRTIAFPDYDTDDLVAIFEQLCRDGGYQPDDATLGVVRAWFEAQPRGKGFGNGRLARNLFETVAGRQASRIVTVSTPSDAELVGLTAADVPAPEAAP